MDGIKCPCGLRNHMEEEDCAKTNCDVCCPLTQTNADRIRAMSDEELAKFLSKPCECTADPTTDGYRECGNNLCIQYLLEWLKQPAED